LQELKQYLKQSAVALLIVGSAILLYSCAERGSKNEEDENMLTQQSDSLTIIQSSEGHREFVFKTPLMERYELAREPYMEFRRGVEITTYDDSTGLEESNLVADYAIFFEKRELWEAKGNVVARNADGQTLYTQQLFWNQSTHRVYSNVDSKVVQGQDVFIGEGFESDDKFEKWSFRKFTGKLTVDPSVTEEPDSVASADNKSNVIENE
jgi:LPS export ABC transporter protein LptC